MITYLALIRLLYCRAGTEPNQNKIHITYRNSRFQVIVQNAITYFKGRTFRG